MGNTLTCPNCGDTVADTVERCTRDGTAVFSDEVSSRVGSHPNIIDVTDFGTTPEGLVFLVMEHLDGERLEDRLRHVRRLPVFDAIDSVGQIAGGLGTAHGQGGIYRDLKPANIFLCRREGRRRIVRRTADEAVAQFTIEPEQTCDFAKLLDFGVAKFMDLGPSAATRAGMLFEIRTGRARVVL